MKSINTYLYTYIAGTNVIRNLLQIILCALSQTNFLLRLRNIHIYVYQMHIKVLMRLYVIHIKRFSIGMLKIVADDSSGRGNSALVVTHRLLKTLICMSSPLLL